MRLCYNGGMKKQEFKRLNQTFSIPIDVSRELRAYVERREMSHFVTEAIRKELAVKKRDLKKAYRAANRDAGQKEAIADWESTIGDGSDEW